MRVLLGISDSSLASEATSLIREGDEFTVVGTATSTTALFARLRRDDVDVVLLHEGLGPLPMRDCARELSTRFPEVGVVLLVRSATPELLRVALQSGARDVLADPLSLEDLHGAIASAGAWSHTLSHRHRANHEVDLALQAAGTMVAIAGAKGGVGTTTVALQVALEAARAPGDRSVCLIDFDLQSGDVRSLLDLSHRHSVADLVPVAHDLTSAHLAASLYTHESGLRILLPPALGEQSEDVTGSIARAVLGGIRSRFDTVVVDIGSVMTEASVIAAEMADTAIVVITPDVPALRAANRLLSLWGRLEARPDDVRVLVNRASKRREVQPDLAAKVLAAPLLEATIPAAFDDLEAATNTGVPDRLDDTPVRKALSEVSGELGLVPRSPPSRPRARLAARRRPVGSETGSIATETAGLALTVLVVIALLWQVVLLGVTFTLTGHAAREGARALAVGESNSVIDERARRGVPGAWRQDMRVVRQGDGVEVTLGVPVLVPGVRTEWQITSRSGALIEQ